MIFVSCMFLRSDDQKYQTFTASSFFQIQSSYNSQTYLRYTIRLGAMDRTSLSSTAVACELAVPSLICEEVMFAPPPTIDPSLPACCMETSCSLLWGDSWLSGVTKLS